MLTFRGGAIHSTRPPGSQTFKSDSLVAAVMLAPSPGIRAAFGSDKLQAFDAPTGMIVISPAGADSRASWSNTRENIVVGFHPEGLSELAANELDADRAELEPPPFGTIDPAALKFAEMLRAELTQCHPPNEIYVDSVITIFGIHLLRNYTGLRSNSGNVRGGLSTYGARRVQEYLAENFAHKLSIADLACVCGLSPGHFIQAFTRTFGEPPHKYIVSQRLSFAENLLVETDLTIAEVAYLSGFSSQSHLTSTMRKYRRMTPARVRAGR